MYLHIDDRLTIGEVEERFSDCFPSLRIAFYSRPHKKYEATDKRFRYPANKLLEEIRHNHVNIPYEVKSWFTVARVERELKEIYGLNVQVFRCDRAGNLIQTTLSDNFTLQQQNDFAYDTDLKG